MDKALDDSAPVLVLAFTLLRLRKLPKQKLDLLGGNNDVGRLSDCQLCLNRFLLVLQLGKPCRERLCDDARLNSFEGVLNSLLDLGQLAFKIEHVAVVLAVAQLHFIAFLADVLNDLGPQNVLDSLAHDKFLKPLSADRLFIATLLGTGVGAIVVIPLIPGSARTAYADQSLLTMPTKRLTAQQVFGLRRLRPLASSPAFHFQLSKPKSVL